MSEKTLRELLLKCSKNELGSIMGKILDEIIVKIDL